MLFKPTPYWRILLLFTIVFLQTTLFQSCKGDENISGSPDEEIIVIGTILDMTGQNFQLGLAAMAAMELAVDEINTSYEAVNVPLRLELAVEDSRGTTAGALEAVNKLKDAGINLIAGGPVSSIELQAIEEFVNTNNMLVLNTFSTSPTLSIPNDNIFRLIPSDEFQAYVLGKMFAFESIEKMYSIFVDDIYGQGLHNELVEQSINLGISLENTFAFDNDNPDAANIMNQLATYVEDLMLTTDSNKIAVELITYQQPEIFLTEAAKHESLKMVNWYGCDGNALSINTLSNDAAFNFAKRVRMLSPSIIFQGYANPEADANKIIAQVEQLIGFQPSLSAISAYEAIGILANCIGITGSIETAEIKKVLPDVCSYYNFLNFSRDLNENGDQQASLFAYWTPVEQNGEASWNWWAAYLNDSDQILRNPVFE